MKTDRSLSASTRTTAILLAGLLLAAGLPAAGQLIPFGKKSKVVVTSESLAMVLARQVSQVQQRFAANRKALQTVRVVGGEPAFLRSEVARLIAGTRDDLVQSIGQVGEPGLDGLAGWADEEIGRIEKELAAAPVRTAASLPGLSTPRAVGMVASLGRLPLLGLASMTAAAPQQETITAETSNRLLGKVGAVVGRIFTLASHDDLEVKLWVGSAPAPQATFSFWPQAKIKGSTPAPLIIQTGSKRDHVLRGLYSYRAARAKGEVNQLIEYPNPAGTPPSGLASERLDLVNGSSFFCCRFNERYCRHVASEKECRP